ncbi:hypothetical protein SOVF_031160 [Spinacia oleracea]|uniref:Uncharacterized serine-rich protein C215.13-like n=1 Tax=Spinacia oleracea TaxID=3562 RepID=A0A9R0K074_SPIOL|nr:uncharacterized serine-rich protein C215.13-like [Spinacia oleracea]KNA22668.1 hypothetical protein SOVF_031160 [Spinacia oleracea]
MAASSAARKSSGPVLRSQSPAGRFYGGSNTLSSSSGFASSSSSSFTSRSFLQRSASPTRVNMYSTASSPSAAVRFNSGSISPSRSISTQSVRRQPATATTGQKKSCMCSPTNHPGSFRCSLHKNSPNRNVSVQPYQSNRLYARRSAMTNSLVRIGTVEGDLVRRALASLIRPSSHQQKRRGDFQPRKSRLSMVSTN